MKKRIKPKISIFCFGSLLLITPVLLATSCSSKTENKIDDKQTPIIKKPGSAKPAEKAKGVNPKPSTPVATKPVTPPAVTTTKPAVAIKPVTPPVVTTVTTIKPAAVTPVQTKLTRAKVVE
jgi:type IV secretory pathway VirB10-like protein